ncbi:MAG: glycosyltransferase family 2 protein [Lachnospiraceae bacterium]|nr:glycosyltransferase family 2 protein [Lachnospiraceae bacterium]
MKISIITPIYEGNQYLNGYLKNISVAAEEFINNRGNSVEVVLVNDSPWEVPEYDGSLIRGFQLKVIENSRNFGIHKSRINGYWESTGDYILFLDQDDLLTGPSLRALAKAIGRADIALGNGTFEKKKVTEDIFANNFSQDFATKPFVYKWIRDFIVSPGQCLIKKSSIPEYWLNHPLKNNGTDDYFLWLLMFNAGAVMVSCREMVYIHRYTGVNYSLNDDKMFLSTREMLHLLRNDPEFSAKDLRLIKRRIYYKRVDRSRKWLFMKESLMNLDILAINVLYRLVWRGCLIRKEEV